MRDTLSTEQKSKLLRSRLEDLCRTAERRGFSAGLFCSQEEQALLLPVGRQLAHTAGLEFRFFGGYPDAERQLPLFSDAVFSKRLPLSYSGIRILALHSASGTPLSHRELLGSLMATGIERDRVGDLLPTVPGSAILIVKDSIADFLMQELHRVGKESVTLQPTTLPPDFSILRQTEQLRETVASLRLDCLAAAICHLSREEAKALILRGELSRNHIPIFDPAAAFAPGDRITVRHFGRFTVETADPADTTRSGRIRVTLLHDL